MNRTFKGRAIVAGRLEGRAVVTHGGFNTYASFFNSIHAVSNQAICADSGNQELFGKDLAGKIICLPNTSGSTSAGAVWQRLVRLGNAPAALLFSRPIDSLAAAGLVVAALWTDGSICTIDQLGEEFLEAVQEGDRLLIEEDGTVTVAG